MTAARAVVGRLRQKRVLPGYSLSFGFTLFYLSSIVLIPLTALLLRPWSLGWNGFWTDITAPRTLAALRLSFGTAALAAAANTILGTITAWTLVRYRFPLRRFLDALIDLPFALPTAVAGIALSTLYAPQGWIGAPLLKMGVKVAYTPLGIVVALTFIGLPFVVRSLEPVLAEMRIDEEEAAATLGASRAQTFLRVILPSLLPALLTGTALAFARGVGEYGSVIFIAGNLPMVSEIAPLLIVIKLEQYDYAGAAALGVAMLVISFGIFLAFNALQNFIASRR